MIVFRSTLLLLPVLFFLLASARAQTTTWTGSVTQFWSEPGNWSDGVPSPGSNAFITNGDLVLLNLSAVAGGLLVSGDSSFLLPGGFELTLEGLVLGSSSGGEMNVSGLGSILTVASPGGLELGRNARGYLEVDGSAVVNVTGGTYSTRLGVSGTGVGVLSLGNTVDGPGTLVTDGIWVETSGTVAFNGGIMQASRNMENLIDGPGQVVVQVGAQGAVIDSGGFDVGLSKNLVGSGTLTVRGASGSLALTGSNSYTGGTLIQSGTLVAGSDYSLGAGTVSVDNTANLGAILRNEASISNQVVLINGGELHNTGTISRSGANQTAVRSSTPGSLVLNTGLLRSVDSHAVQLESSGTVQNIGGTISAAFNGVYTVNAPGFVTNEEGGLIEGGGHGIHFLQGGSILNVSSTISSSGGDGIDGGSVGGSISIIENEDGGYIFGGRHGILVGNSSTITNSGSSTISGNSSGVTLNAGGSLANGVGSLISSSGTAVVARNAAISLENSGTISGDVMLGDFANVATLNVGSFIDGDLVLGTAVTAQLILAGTGTATYSAAVSGGTTFSGTLIKQGNSFWDMDAALAGVSHTLVQQGRLFVSGALGGGATVGNGASLGGTGLISGAVSIQDGGVLVSGANAGTLSVDSLNLASGALLTYELGAASSFVAITNDLVVAGSNAFFEFGIGTGFLPNLTYEILSASNLTDAMLPLFVGNDLFGLAPIFSVDGSTLRVGYFGTMVASGALLQNSAGIPFFADFIVNGAVMTGSPTESNTINALFFNAGSSLQVFNNLTVTSGNFTVSDGAASVAGGTVVVPGTFSKLGSGSLNLASNVFVNGPANINAGALYVNGVFSAIGGLTVFQNALLGGTGIINGNVFNSGIVAPGNSPGTLTINGNFTQTGSGLLEIEIASLSNFDRLIVSGNASLAGQLQVVSFDGYEFEYGQQFAFLQAGSISGAFDSIVTSDPSNFRARFLTSGGTGSILLAPTRYTLVAQTTNQHNVAAALDSYIPAASGDRATVSIALDLLSAEQYPAAFEQIMPGFYESLTDITIEQAVMQNQMLAQRMSAVRLGARGFSAIGIESPLINDKDGKSVLDAKDGKDILAPTIDNKWGVWVQGNGIFAKTVSASQVPNYHTEAGGFLVGADYRWSENFTTGVYLGYQGLYARYTGGSNMSINSALFGGYATYENGGFYTDLVVGGGYNGYSARRSIEFSTIDRTARSTPNGGQFTTYLDLGYDWNAGGFTFGPIVSAQYTYSGVAPFTETGADSLDLRVGQQNANSIRTNLGGRVAYTWNATENIVIIPELRLFWQHEFLQNPTNIAASLDGGAGPGFGYETSTPDRDSIFAGAGVSAQFGKNWGGYIFYNSDFARQDTLTHAISVGLNWKF